MIFINYRRLDTNPIVDRLYADLVARFGEAAVFRDKGLPTGRWPDQIRDRLARAKVVLAVMGHRWQDARMTEGEHRGWLRLHLEDDWVRNELRFALDKGTTIIVVRYNEALLPDRGWLSHFGLGDLLDWQWTELRDRSDDYHNDLERLVEGIRSVCPELEYSEPSAESPPDAAAQSQPRQREELLASADADLRNNRLQDALQTMTQVDRDYWGGRYRDRLSELQRRLAEVRQSRSDYDTAEEYRAEKRRVNADVAKEARILFHELEKDPPNDPVAAQSVSLPVVERPALVQTVGLGLTLRRFALNNIDLKVRPGRIVAVVGGNGSGKSTLLRILAHRWAHERGTIEYELGPRGTVTTDPVAIWREIGFVEQDPPRWRGALIRTLFLEAAQRFRRHADRKKQVDYAINRLGLMELKGERWKSLSCGQRMRFELARVLVRKPKLLVLDEPLAWLDPDIREKLLRILKEEARSEHEPKGVVLSSHHMESIERFADEIVCLDEGEVKLEGDVHNLYPEAEPSVYEYAFDDMKGVPSKERASEYLTLREDDEVHPIVGRYIVTSARRELGEEGLQRVHGTSRLLSFRDLTQSVFRHFLSSVSDEPTDEDRDQD